MEHFYKILKFAYPYKRMALLNALLNILSVVFGLFSFTLVIPMLGILFDTQQKVTNKPTRNLMKSSFVDITKWKELQQIAVAENIQFFL